jgi:hypothetical protein
MMHLEKATSNKLTAFSISSMHEYDDRVAADQYAYNTYAKQGNLTDRCIIDFHIFRL